MIDQLHVNIRNSLKDERSRLIFKMNSKCAFLLEQVDLLSQRCTYLFFENFATIKPRLEDRVF